MTKRSRLPPGPILPLRNRRFAFRWRPSRRACLGAALWALVASLPALWVPPPPPYALGAVAEYDLRARVDFPWRDQAAEEREIQHLRDIFPNRYSETPADAWAPEIISPLRRLYDRIHAAKNAEEFAAAHVEKPEIELTPDQAQLLWRQFIRVGPIDFYYQIDAPLMQLLTTEIHRVGVMDDVRYAAERERRIRIQYPGSSQTDHSVPVGLTPPWSSGGQGPWPLKGIEGWLDRRLENESQWKGRYPAEFRLLIREVLVRRLKPTLVFNEAVSKHDLEDREAEIRKRTNQVSKDEILVGRGDRVFPATWSKMRAEADAFQRVAEWWRPWLRWIGKFLLFLLLGLSFALYVAFVETRPEVRAKALWAGAAAGEWATAWSYFLAWTGLAPTLAPIGLAVGVLALGLRPRLALAGSFAAALTVLAVWDARADTFVGILAASFAAGLVLPRMRWRGTLFGVTLVGGILGAMVFLIWRIASGVGFEEGMWTWAGAGAEALALIGSWLVCGLILMALPRIIERLFGATTRVRVQEALESDRPLLRRMLEEAPGTYQHSVVVAALAEAGAEASGGDGLLARAGGYYHDIGKLSKPEYFSENESGPSLHNRLAPSMSAMILHSHVKDGIEYAEAARLSPAIADIVREHHGTTLAAYFLHKAKTAAKQNGEPVDEGAFRYPGPRPRSREAAAVMMADAVEAATRSMQATEPGKMRDIAHKLFMARLEDGQFSASGLSLEELARMEEAFVRMLGSMYHGRVRYPDGGSPTTPWRLRRNK